MQAWETAVVGSMKVLDESFISSRKCVLCQFCCMFLLVTINMAGIGLAGVLLTPECKTGLVLT